MSPKTCSSREQHAVSSHGPHQYNGLHGLYPSNMIGEDGVREGAGRVASLRCGSGGGRRAHSPWNHTYTEIRERERERALRMDDPVYEEIERGGELHASDLSDDDGRRQSDMSRQSSRSYGDHRPLIPYSPGATAPLGPLRYAPAPPNQCDIARTVAVLDGDTVVCHLEPDHSLYPVPYSECYSLH